MRRFLTGISFFLIFSLNCIVAQQSAADAPASREDVQRYLQTINYHDMMSKMVDAMSKPMHQMIHDQYMKDKDNLPADFEARTNQRMDEMMKDMPWDDIVQAMVPSYQKHFTKGDMDSLIAFYSGSTGQKVLREMPAIMGESMQAMMPIMKRHMEAVNQSIQQEMAQMEKDSQKPGSSK